MKKLLLTAALVFACGVAFAEAGQSTIEGRTWVRYTHKTYDGETSFSGFGVERGYFSWGYEFSDKINSKFTVDIYTTDKDGAKGAGLKIKAAYLEFKQFPYVDAALQAGVIKSYFGTTHDYEYQIISTELADMQKVAPSADLGLAFDGVLPKGFGTYQLYMMNGEGYSSALSKIDKYPLFGVNVRFIPIAGLTVGGTFNTTTYDADTAVAVENEKNITKLAGVLRAAYGPVDVWGEYISLKKDETTSSGFSVMPLVTVWKNLQLTGRFDQWDPNTDVDDDGLTRFIVGANWAFTKDTKGKPTTSLQINYQSDKPEVEDSKATNQILVQLVGSFKSNPF